MKICLVFPNSMELPKHISNASSIVGASRIFAPLGMLYIISNSSKKIDFFDNKLNKYSDKKLYDKLKKYDVVGFGGTVLEVKQAKDVAKLLKDSGIVTVYGGPNATIDYNRYINDFDFIIRGEGEITFEELLNSLENKEFFDNITGLTYKRNGKIIHNPDRPYIKNLDVLKYPARKILNFNRYSRQHAYVEIRPLDMIVSSRGCPFECTFCSSKLIWKRIYRARTAKSVIEEVKYMMDNFGTKGIFFREDLFTASRQRILDFCSLIEPLGIKWGCESRVDTIDEELAIMMGKAGCTGIFFGVESCSDKTLKLIKKGITIENVREAVRCCHKAGIICGGTFIAGFPWETKEDILSGFEEAKDLGFNRIGFYRLVGLPRSELYELFIRERLNRYEYEGIIIPDTRYLHADEVTDMVYNELPSARAYIKLHGGKIK